MVAEAPAIPAPAPLKSGLDLAGFDRSVRPQDDLYRFVGGNWLANTEIPPDRSNYGSFIILDDQAQEEVKNLIVAASQQPNRAPGSDAQKVGDYYLAFMNTERVERLGLEPLRAELAPHRRHRHAARCGALHRARAAPRRRPSFLLVFDARQQELDACTSARCSRAA